MLDTISLQCFIAVAETLSFTKAALKVGRTQSAISQQIAKLEHLIEKSLFIRGRELALTPDGELFLSYATRIYALHRESLDRFKAPEIQGSLKFGLPEDFAYMMLSDILVEFPRLHPRVTLNVECDLTLNLLKRFQHNEFDLILVKSNERHVIPHGVDVWNEPVDWVGKIDRLPDLSSTLPLVLSPTPCVYRENVIESLNQQGLKWRLAFSSPSFAGKIAAVKAGLGITALQRSMIPPYLDKLTFDFLPPLNDIHVSLLKTTQTNAAINSLEYFILNQMSH